MEEIKKCCRCKTLKALTEFYNNKSTKVGLHNECKSCKTELYYLNKEKLFPKVPCNCGKTLDKYYLKQHLKTKKHQQSNVPMILVN
jgi:hypothetical protein